MSTGQMQPGDECLSHDSDHTTCTHPEGATLWLGGNAWAHPALRDLLRPTTSVHTYPGNPRRGDQDAITASIRDLGIYKAQLTTQTTTGHILTGNHTYRGLTDLGATLVPVTDLAVGDTVAAAIVERDNHTSDLGGYDDGERLQLLERLDAEGALALAGHTDDDLLALRQLLADSEAPPAKGPSLADRFLVPPFSVLDARQGVWLARKREWLGLGIVSEVGRDSALLGGTVQGGQGAAMSKTMATGATRSRNGAYGGKATTGADGSLSYEVAQGATSIFDPVVCELAYRWFSPTGAHVLDPFAGGSVRGIVAAALERTYTGIELRGEQVAANEEQWTTISPRLGEAERPRWVQGDSRHLGELLDTEGPTADLLFSCPPYADLEVYSEDPADLSNMAWPEFTEAYRAIIAASVERLRPNRFAVWVVGEVRDKRGNYRDLVGETVQAFRDAGCRYYNDAVLITPAGSLPVRAGKLFTASRKLGKSHQNVLVFLKGDAKAATAYAGAVDVHWPEGWDVDQ